MKEIKQDTREKPPIIIPSGRLSIVSGIAILLTIAGVDILANKFLTWHMQPLRVNILTMMIEALCCGAATVGILRWLGTSRKEISIQQPVRHAALMTVWVSLVSVAVSAIFLHISSTCCDCPRSVECFDCVAGPGQGS
jgi:hypothetical protein